MGHLLRELIRQFPVPENRLVGVRRFGGVINGWASFTFNNRGIIFMGSGPQNSIRTTNRVDIFSRDLIESFPDVP